PSIECSCDTREANIAVEHRHVEPSGSLVRTTARPGFRSLGPVGPKPSAGAKGRNNRPSLDATLSRQKGHVSVQWDQRANRHAPGELVLDWREDGGPPVPPSGGQWSRGFVINVTDAVARLRLLYACWGRERAIASGTMHMRTHVEVDPRVG